MSLSTTEILHLTCVKAKCPPSQRHICTAQPPQCGWFAQLPPTQPEGENGPTILDHRTYALHATRPAGLGCKMVGAPVLSWWRTWSLLLWGSAAMLWGWWR